MEQVPYFLVPYLTTLTVTFARHGGNESEPSTTAEAPLTLTVDSLLTAGSFRMQPPAGPQVNKGPTGLARSSEPGDSVSRCELVDCHIDEIKPACPPLSEHPPRPMQALLGWGPLCPCRSQITAFHRATDAASPAPPPAP
jgi:hypothetical protein